MALAINTNSQTLIELKKLTMVQFSSLRNTITNVNLFVLKITKQIKSIFELGKFREKLYVIKFSKC